MKNPIFHPLDRAAVTRYPAGFALVVTLSLMILLTVIAVGLLTLATISLRSSSQSHDMNVARGNARMALMLALGDLQKLAGPDTRITARADITASGKPPVTGVWKSWEGTDHESNGRPIAPDYAEHKKARFLGWLTSDPRASDLDQIPDTAAGTNKVKLVGPGSVGMEDPARRQVYLSPVKITGGGGKPAGSLAWWVAGENQKARLPKPYEHSEDTAAKWSVMAKSHAIADTEPFGLDALLTPETPLNDPAATSRAGKVHTLKQGDLLSSKTLSQENFHDLTTTSTGLLTNTATGGWRKDLSLATEYWGSLPTGGLPFFRLNPTKDLVYTKAGGSSGGSPTSKKSLLYHWSDYRAATTGEPIYRTPAISSWTSLANYATMYKKFGAAASGNAMTTRAAATDIISGDTYTYLHTPRVMPVIGRIQWVFSHKAVSTNGSYTLQLLVQPVITMWNPYNVKINAIPDLRFSLGGTLPPVISYKVGGHALAPPNNKMVTLQDNHDNKISDSTRNRGTGVRGAHIGQCVYNVNNVADFNPGETRVFSAPGAVAGGTLTLVPGLYLTGGSVFNIATQVASSGPISTDVEFNAEYDDKNGATGGVAKGPGLYLDMKMGSAHVLAYRMSYTKSLADKAYPPMPANGFPPVTLSQAASSATPFLCVTFGARMATNTFLPSKGFVQSSPFVNYTAMGLKGPIEQGLQFQYPGTLHNVNSPFEYSFQAISGGSDTKLPQAETGTNRGFILTGITANDGLKRCVIDELPGRPLNSLVELQNWDARFENPVPPFCFNLVGNSDATPLIPSDRVVNSSVSKGAENLQHDDSYCLNHALFDDWFFSSIAPEPRNFGNAAASSTVKSVYTDLLTDPSSPLLNRSYKAILEDTGEASVSGDAASAVATRNVGSAATSWKTIASRLEVEGMFNVNSTSVNAWRALLGHARNQKIPYLNAGGGNSLSAPRDYTFSRFTVAGDVEHSGNGASGNRAGAAEFAGYRILDDDHLDLLAEEIVNQVRLRGPFLSLSEFVNRQLSSGDLALAGAVQTALNVLTANTSMNPFTVLQEDPDDSGSNLSSENPPPNDPGSPPSGYEFAKAAAGPSGYSLYGVPGWTRQADVLRPLAPILTVRDDTFTIRAYGDSRDATGTVVKARALCEATVRRTRNHVDSRDDAATADLSNSSGTVPGKQPVNEIFGRRFEIISFRWLSPNEI